MKTEAQKNSFIAQGRTLAKHLAELRAFDKEYDATDAGNVILDEDFTGVNEGITAADLSNFQIIIKAILTTIDSVSGRETIIQNYKNV